MGNTLALPMDDGPRLEAEAASHRDTRNYLFMLSVDFFCTSMLRSTIWPFWLTS